MKKKTFERESTKSSFNFSTFVEENQRNKNKNTNKGRRFSKVILDQEYLLRSQNAVIFFKKGDEDLKIFGNRIFW